MAKLRFVLDVLALVTSLRLLVETRSPAPKDTPRVVRAAAAVVSSRSVWIKLETPRVVSCAAASASSNNALPAAVNVAKAAVEAPVKYGSLSAAGVKEERARRVPVAAPDTTEST